jgi:hypothetical protein
LDWFINHFPDGETDPNYCIIKFTAKRASLWIDNESAEFMMDELLIVQSRCGLLCHGCEDYISGKCPGCIALNGKSSWRRDDDCDWSRCCINKGLSHCGDCPDFPCWEDNEFDIPPGSRNEVCKAWACKGFAK